jgi:hypothetical protein
MKKLNSTVYNKLLLQAEEAKDQDMIKLASAIVDALGPEPEDIKTSYNLNQLQQDMHQGLWKLATCVIKYHDLESVDAEKVNDVLEALASKIIEDIELSLNVDDTKVGPLEDVLPGQSK